MNATQMNIRAIISTISVQNTQPTLESTPVDILASFAKPSVPHTTFPTKSSLIHHIKTWFTVVKVPSLLSYAFLIILLSLFQNNHII